MDDPRDPFDGFVVGVVSSHVGDVDYFQTAFAEFLRNVLGEKLGFVGVARGAADIEAGRNHLFHDNVADEASGSGHEHGLAFLDEGHLSRPFAGTSLLEAELKSSGGIS